MLTVFLTVLPVILLIGLGYGLNQRKFLSADGWSALERLTYFVLFPALLFHDVATANLKDPALIRMALALFMAQIAIVWGLLALRPRLKMDGRGFSSLFQGAVRWNSMIAIALSQTLLGPKGVALAAVGLAVLVPTANLFCVYVLNRYAAQKSGDMASTVFHLATNPLLVAVALGIMVNISGVAVPDVAITLLKLMAGAALPLGLLTAGAALDLGTAMDKPLEIVAATVLKLAVMPALVAATVLLFQVDGPMRTVALVCAAVPTAPSAYVLARQLGGDSTLMASLITASTVAGIFTLPMVLLVAR